VDTIKNYGGAALVALAIIVVGGVLITVAINVGSKGSGSEVTIPLIAVGGSWCCSAS
jgi:ABC-type transport system involved in multi-copper enzyme maturation permease subunit